jgi:hypothetical protein
LPGQADVQKAAALTGSDLAKRRMQLRHKPLLPDAPTAGILRLVFQDSIPMAALSSFL